MTYLGLLSLLEEGLFASLILGLLGGEVLGLGDLLDLGLVQTGDVHLVGGGDDVSGVDSSQRNAVDLEGAGDEEDTLVEGLEEDDALATEATSKDNQDGTGLKRLTRGPGANGLADLRREELAGALEHFWSRMAKRRKPTLRPAPGHSFAPVSSVVFEVAAASSFVEQQELLAIVAAGDGIRSTQANPALSRHRPPIANPELSMRRKGTI